MLISRVILKNWRNFRELDVQLGPRAYLIGANASGKSNFLEVFRFLRDLAKTSGGGLQEAVKNRGGLSKLRSLHARKDPEIRIEVHLSESAGDSEPEWIYVLAFRGESTGLHRVLVTEETVHQRGKQPILTRPNKGDGADSARLTQTHLEQINNNSKFRPIAEHFQATTYLHLVPQLLKHAGEIAGRHVESDPFGQGLLQRIAKTQPKSRDARLKRVQQALAVAVPQFSELHFKQDPVTGYPHLETKFSHWRPQGAWQREDQFSDGTLRLIGLLWALQDGDGALLLEEPELSLNDAIVALIPLMIDRVLRKRALLSRQVIISTHSAKLLSRLKDPESVLLLVPGANGTTVRNPDSEEIKAMKAGLNAAEVLMPKTRPSNIDQLGLFERVKLSS